MRHTEAIKILIDLHFTIQKTRSNLRESIAQRLGHVEPDALDEEMLEQMYPWLFGKKCLLIPLNSILERLEDDTKTLDPGDFYNILTALWIKPETWTIVFVAAKLIDRTPPPEPDYTWLKGWDS